MALTKAEYVALQERVIQIAKMAHDTDVDQMLEMMDRADSVGPFVDPTLWIRGHEKMNIIREMALGVKRLKAVVAANRDRLISLEARTEDAGWAQEARRALDEG